MNKKRLTVIFFSLLTVLFMLVPKVSAQESAHEAHTACEAIRTEQDLERMRSGGKYYLEADITVSAPLEIEAEVALCLNGKVLRYENESGCVFRIGKGGTLRIFDCSENVYAYTKETDGLWSLTDGEGEETLTGGVIIGGKGAEGEIDGLDGTYLCGGFACVDGGSLFLHGGNIIGNQADYGGAVYITGEGHFEMDGGRLGGNLSSVRGGGVFIENGEMLLHSGSVSSNRSVKNGGGIDIAEKGALEMRGGFIGGNQAGVWGGGVENFGKLDMFGGTVSANSAKEDGGGVYNGGTFALHGGSVRENSARYGGGVCSDGEMTLYDGVIRSNLAKESGAGIYNGGSLVINGGLISSNTADVSGGGIENDGTCSMYGGVIGGSSAEDANAAYLGGGVCVYSGSFAMYGGSIERNTAVDGGGVENEAVFSMESGTVAYNFASVQGGGVTNRGGMLLSGDAAIVSNASGALGNEYAGGGIYWIAEENSFISVSDGVTVTGNSTVGASANLVIFGDGALSVSNADDTMRIGLTLLDRNKEAGTGRAVCFDLAKDSEKASILFASDTEGFMLQPKDGDLLLVKKSADIVPLLVFLTLFAVAGAVFFLIVAKNRQKSRRFKKRV